MNLGGTTTSCRRSRSARSSTLLPKIRRSRSARTACPDLSQVEDLLEICLAALKRNYPEITLEELGDIVDLGNFKPLVAAVMGSRASRCEQRRRETDRGRTASRSTGAPSTRASARSSAGTWRVHRCRDGPAAAEGDPPLLGHPPPVHELFAAFAGYKAPARRPPRGRRTTRRRCCRDLMAAGIAIPPTLLHCMTWTMTDGQEATADE
jgi:hypothetical protein